MKYVIIKKYEAISGFPSSQSPDFREKVDSLIKQTFGDLHERIESIIFEYKTKHRLTNDDFRRFGRKEIYPNKVKIFYKDDLIVSYLTNAPIIDFLF